MTIGIIFDMDGTLLDSEKLCAKAFVQLLGPFPVSETELAKRYRGVKVSDIFTDMASRYGKDIPDQVVPLYREILNSLYETELEVFPGVFEALETLSSDYPICLASNAPMERLERLTKLTGLDRFFADRLFSAYDVRAWKPEPQLFLTAAESMRVTPDRCFVIEDSEPGLIAAQAAGMFPLVFDPSGPTSLDCPHDFDHYDSLPDRISRLAALMS